MSSDKSTNQSPQCLVPSYKKQEFVSDHKPDIADEISNRLLNKYKATIASEKGKAKVSIAVNLTEIFLSRNSKLDRSSCENSITEKHVVIQSELYRYDFTCWIDFCADIERISYTSIGFLWGKIFSFLFVV